MPGTIRDDATRTSSPYFANKPRAPQLTQAPACASAATHRRSRHFASSQSHAAESVASMGSFLETLVVFRPVRTVRDPQSAIIAEEAASLFLPCSKFATRYRQHHQSMLQSNSSTSVESETEAIMEHSVRHLCGHGCFYWAYAPAREWHSLREAVRSVAGCRPERILQGWRCSLMPIGSEEQQKKRSSKNKSSQQFTTIFISPDGGHFGNAKEVMAELRLSGSRTTCAKKSRISGTMRSLPKAGEPPKIKRKTRSGDSTQQPVSIARQILFNELDDSLGSHESSGEIEQVDTSVWSPFGLLEELFADDPWKLLLSTILLNRTTRIQVDSIFAEFLARWPTAKDAASADVEDILGLVTPLGIKYRRSSGIVRFSKEYVELVKSKHSQHFSTRETHIMEFEDDEILNLYGCGRYALSAYNVFIRRDLDCAVHDHALHWYADYKQSF